MWRNLIIFQQNERYLRMSSIKGKMGQEHKIDIANSIASS